MEEKVFYSGESQQMLDAYDKARQTFKYFWRELYWEQHRIIPGLDMAAIKMKFTQEDASGKVLVEQMWVDEIEFDGINIRGILLNSPDELTNVEEGDEIEIPYTEITDWMFVTRGKSYGGFTIQVLRAEMDEEERKEHDEAWGIDFGDADQIQVVYQEDIHPENLVEHPMCRNMEESYKKFLEENPDELTCTDELGYTKLHEEAIAGNKTCVEVLLQMGADINARTKSGYTAYDFAKKLNWEHLLPVFESKKMN